MSSLRSSGWCNWKLLLSICTLWFLEYICTCPRKFAQDSFLFKLYLDHGALNSCLWQQFPSTHGKQILFSLITHGNWQSGYTCIETGNTNLYEIAGVFWFPTAENIIANYSHYSHTTLIEDVLVVTRNVNQYSRVWAVLDSYRSSKCCKGNYVETISLFI